jgi:CRISPR-associated protein Cas2
MTAWKKWKYEEDRPMKSNETLVWVLYDIQKDKSRTRAAKACKEAGLYRVQYSVFLGTIQHNRLDELSMQLETLIDPKQDKVYMFPMCEMDFKKVILQGQAFDEKLVRDEVKNLFL